jgi:hypothetical protein
MTEDQVEDLARCLAGEGYHCDPESKLQFHRASVQRQYLYTRLRSRQYRIAAQENRTHHIGHRGRRGAWPETDRERHAVAPLGTAEIGQPCFREVAVGDNHKVVCTCQKMGGPPIRLDHPAFHAVAQHKPVPDSVRPGEIECYA